MTNFDLMATFNENIRELMRLHGLTQEKLAQKSGLQQPAIARLLNDTDPNPKIKTLIAIASAFEVEVSDLLRKKRKKLAV
jgi:transcriptional regulator with XRE-family HTH domain